MRAFDYIKEPEKLLTPEIVQMTGKIHEHKGKQEIFLEANIDELKTLLEVALIQSTGASNRIEGIYTTDKRLEELVSQRQNQETDLSRKSQVTERCFLQSTKAMSILCPDLILFYSFIVICIPTPVPVENIKMLIM